MDKAHGSYILEDKIGNKQVKKYVIKKAGLWCEETISRVRRRKCYKLGWQGRAF